MQWGGTCHSCSADSMTATGMGMALSPSRARAATAAARRSVCNSPTTKQSRMTSGTSMNALAMVSGPTPAESPWVMAIAAWGCVESGIFGIRIRQAGHSHRACSKRPRPLGGPIVGEQRANNRPASGRIVDLDETVLQPQLQCHLPRQGRRTIALGRMVAGSQEGHARLARQVRLRLGNLARDEGIGPSGNRGLEETLCAARAPGNAANG